MSESNGNPDATVVENIVQQASETVVNFVNQNLTNGTNETEKFKASPEGLILAYSSLVIMALIPIIIGSFKSVKHQKNQQESGEEIETMSTREALLFPVIASCTLFGIYIVFQLFHKDYINLLLAFYFFLLGIIALTRMTSSFMGKFLPSSLIPNNQYEIDFSLKSGKAPNIAEIIGLKHVFDNELIICFVFSLAIGVWYFMKKHWIANNIFGLAFSVNGIEFLQLNKIVNGFILLGGLFFYDIFWVFGTNVMVTVAKSFDAPIKLIFPQDLIEHGIYAEKYALLGLGDIVIPGIFIALLLRFDYSLNRRRNTYFIASFIAYVLALLTTIFVMHVFKHAQPALLYIVPLCLIAPLIVAVIQGDLKRMFTYRDHEEVSEQSNNTSIASNEENSGNESSKETKKTN